MHVTVHGQVLLNAILNEDGRVYYKGKSFKLEDLEHIGLGVESNEDMELAEVRWNNLSQSERIEFVDWVKRTS